MSGQLGIVTDIGSVGATSSGTIITTGIANTKGVYTQLTAATTRDTHWLWIQASNSPSTGTNLSLDIAVGAALSEQIIVADVLVADTTPEVARLIFPLIVPTGSRIAVRGQSTAISDTCAVSLLLGSGGLDFKSFSKVETYGFQSASTAGLVVDPGASANTKGAYREITSSTLRNHKGFLYIIDSGGSTAASANILMDIALGAAGSEQVIIPNLLLRSTSTFAGVAPPFSGFIPYHIPAASRIAVRAQSSNNTSGSRKFGITIYGVS